MIALLHKWRLDHILFGWLLIAGFSLGAWPMTRNYHAALLLAWGLQSAYWLGREIRDMEIKLKADLPREWYRAWDLRNWRGPDRRDNRHDFLRPVVGNLVLVIAIIVFT